MIWKGDGAVDGEEFDAVIIGGGILGSGIAWDASLRGLRVLLVERGDIGGETSAGCFNIIHGGLRYLQHLDLRRLHESAREQNALCRMAPHLTAPLPILVPCYGYGKKGMEALRIATTVYELLARERNVGVPTSERLLAAGCRTVGEVLALAPGVRQDGLRGGVVFSDARMASSERVTLAVARTAEQHGATLALSSTVTGVEELDLDGGRARITAVHLRHAASERTAKVGTKFIVNAAGPWREEVAAALFGRTTSVRHRVFCRSVQCVLAGEPSRIAVAVDSPHVDHDSVLQRGGRSYFLIPVGGNVHLGTYESSTSDRPPAPWTVTADEVRSFLREASSAYSWSGFDGSPLLHAYGGVIPVVVRQGGGHVAEKRDAIEQGDISSRSGRRVENVIHAAGVKFTTFRKVAEQVTDRVCSALGRGDLRCRTFSERLIGAELSGREELLSRLDQSFSGRLDSVRKRELVALYGGELHGMLDRMAGEAPAAMLVDAPSQLTAMEVTQAFDHEHAESLADLIFRRTTLGYRGFALSPHASRIGAGVARLRGWSPERIEGELRAVSRTCAACAEIRS